MPERVQEVAISAESWSAEGVMRWAFSQFHPEVALVTAFGPEGLVLIDMAARLGTKFRIITVDTDFLFAETYALIERVERHYQLIVERVRPVLTPQEQERSHGRALWKRAPDKCCQLRKVDPLRTKLVELRAWMTGIRRDQTAARRSTRKIAWDTKFGLVKISPLADWSTEQIWNYLYTNDVPYNPLHDRAYPSIGCTFCTREVLPGEDSRAGRWAGSNKTECGLHVLSEEASV